MGPTGAVVGRNLRARALDTHDASAYDLVTARHSLGRFDPVREDAQPWIRSGPHPHALASPGRAGSSKLAFRWSRFSGRITSLINVSVRWDTRNRNVVDVTTRRMPAGDQAFAALPDDLDARGLLDEAFVVRAGASARGPNAPLERPLRRGPGSPRRGARLTWRRG